MRRFSLEAKVGVFVLAALMVLVYMSTRVGKPPKILQNILKRGIYSVSAVFDSAEGVEPNANVKISGVRVGSVNRIDLEGSQARIYMEIDQMRKIPADSKAILQTRGILGDKFVVIKLGQSSRILQDGDEFHMTETPPDLSQMFTSLGTAANNIGNLTNAFRDALGGPEAPDRISTLLKNIVETSATLLAIVNDSKPKMERLFTNLDHFSGELENILKGTDNVVTTINRLAKEVDQGKGTLGRLLKDESIYSDFHEAISNFKKFSREIDSGQGTMGKLIGDDRLYEETISTLSALRQIVQRIQSGQGTMGKLVQDETLYDEAREALRGVNRAAKGLEEQTPVTVLGTVVGTALK